MKKSRLIVSVLVGLVYALLTLVVLVLLVGAIMFCKAIVMDIIPTTIERIGMIFVMVAGGILAAFVVYDDKGGDDNA